jgi:hypothetical protein
MNIRELSSLRSGMDLAGADRTSWFQGGTMNDLYFVLLILGFFGLAWAYTAACERL